MSHSLSLRFPHTTTVSRLPLILDRPTLSTTMALRDRVAGLIVEHVTPALQGTADTTPLSILDANNSFPLFALSRWARRSGLSPREVLAHLRVRRSFTAYQAVATMEALVRDLPPQAPLLILGLLDAFHDEEVMSTDDPRARLEGERLWHKAMRFVQRLEHRTDTLYLVDTPCTHPHWKEMTHTFGAHLLRWDLEDAEHAA